MFKPVKLTPLPQEPSLPEPILGAIESLQRGYGIVKPLASQALELFRRHLAPQIMRHLPWLKRPPSLDGHPSTLSGLGQGVPTGEEIYQPGARGSEELRYWERIAKSGPGEIE